MSKEYIVISETFRIDWRIISAVLILPQRGWVLRTNNILGKLYMTLPFTQLQNDNLEGEPSQIQLNSDWWIVAVHPDSATLTSSLSKDVLNVLQWTSILWLQFHSSNSTASGILQSRIIVYLTGVTLQNLKVHQTAAFFSFLEFLYYASTPPGVYELCKRSMYCKWFSMWRPMGIQWIVSAQFFSPPVGGKVLVNVYVHM